MLKEKDYIENSKRHDDLMAVYRQLKKASAFLKEHESRSWKSVDVSAAKVLREARKLMKSLKTKRARR